MNNLYLRFRRFIIFSLLFFPAFAGILPQLEAQDEFPSSSAVDVSVTMDGWFPKLIDPDNGISNVFGITTQAKFLPFGPFSLLARAGVYSLQTGTKESLLYAGGAGGLHFTTNITDSLSLNLSAYAGLGKIPDIKVPDLEEKNYGLYEVGGRVDASFQISAAMKISLFAGFERLATPTAAFIDAPAAGIGFRITPGELLRTRGHIDFVEIRSNPVFPVLRSWYSTDPLGTVSLRNLEDGPIEKVRVYFHVPEYMGGPRLCASSENLEKGEEFEVPLYAVFDERILNLTENSRSNATVEVEYSRYGTQRVSRETFSLQIYHRNTMSWEDDRRAAAFVSPTDPASLWFSRYAGSIARDRMRTDLPRNLQNALSIFEGLRLYGVNYVVDPNSSYIELSKNATALDFLQYPKETLTYRGGDCDDLSILYCSLLEASGISTAFITIPGHIYMAFDLGMSEKEAKKQFFDPGLLIFHENRAWAPIEITMVQEGFVKAWRIGAKQWVDNEKSGNADFFPMRENWDRYPPSALPGAEARFALPEESDLMVAFDESIDRFVIREIGPTINEFDRQLVLERDPETLNDYGVILAKAGMLDDAWEKFAEAADAGYVWAWNNLASIAFIRKNYELSRSYYEWAESLLPEDPVAILGKARAAYEMDLYRESELLYTQLLTSAPSLAERFGYLASIYGGSGRAWSMTDRLSSIIWSEPGLAFTSDTGTGTDTRTGDQTGTPREPVQIAGNAGDAGTARKTASAEAVASAGAVSEGGGERSPNLFKREVPSSLVVSMPDQEEEPSSRIAEPLDPPVEAEAALEPEVVVESEEVIEPEPMGPVTGDQPEQEAPSEAVGEAEEVVMAEIEAEPSREHGEQEKTPEPVSKPPEIQQKAPEDTEISSRRQRSTKTEVSVPKESEPPPDRKTDRELQQEPKTQNEQGFSAPPQIAKKAPSDVEIIEKEKKEEDLRVALTDTPEVEKTVPKPNAEPEPEADAKAERESLPEPEADAKAEPETEVEAELEPEAEPASVREPKIALAPEPEPEPEIEKKPTVESMPEHGTEPDIEVTQAEPEPEVEPEPETVSVEESESPIRVSFLDDGIRPANGEWRLGTYLAEMTDQQAMYAKLILPSQPVEGPMVYEFKARSTGSGFVGFGIHIHGLERKNREKWKLSHFGGGDSILIWVTSDPEAYGNAAPRLQIYYSRGEVWMKMTNSAVIPGTVFDLREYRIDYDPAGGNLSVRVDGTEYLNTDGFLNPPQFDYFLLRALNSAEFSDLSVHPLHRDSISKEKSDE